MVEFRSSSAVNFGNRTDTIIPAPVGIQDSDLLVIPFYIDTQPPTPPPGFAAFTNLGPLAYPVNNSDLWAWWKRASGESGNYTITHNATFTNAVMLVYRNAIGSGSPEDVPPSTRTGNVDPNIVANGIAPVTSGSMIIYVSSVFDPYPAPPLPPGGITPTFTERYNPGTTNVLHVCDGALIPAGPTGNKTVTGGPNLGDWVASLIAIRPA